MNVIRPEIKIYKNPHDLADALAADFKFSVDRATKSEQNYYVALSGGSTPFLFFERLASASYRENISWQHVHFFWGDERCVPPDHPDSNYGMTKKKLLDHITIPGANIHRIAGENDPVTEAMRYAKEIKNVTGQQHRALPQFDWILLGLGTDGHTASLFPGPDVTGDRKNNCVVTTHPETGQKRISLSLPVINHTKRVSFLVTGAIKASLIAKILTGAEESQSLPASLVEPVNGILEWYLDQAAGTIWMKQGGA